MKIWISVLIVTIYFVGLLYPFAFKPGGSMRARNKIDRPKREVLRYIPQEDYEDGEEPVTH
uniref:RIC3 domain-containing protein n=1 Tax=Parastrongyloides trichosuri TaxID=131310 RepID=A0A0N4Z4W4_PARTI